MQQKLVTEQWSLLLLIPVYEKTSLRRIFIVQTQLCRHTRQARTVF